ncbi:MAG: hypothetical protein DMG03_09610 [Acidobacteria bacterium]|nr:MAG: hypothetical protein DMG03_09610 [Acidobacteriota bacterium]
MAKWTIGAIVCALAIAGRPAASQTFTSETFAGLKARSIGPAVTSGRVMTIAVDPANKAVIYVGAASGGVWKTTNGGASWQPIFDTQGSFSIGWVTVDPKRPNVVWVGTGERNSQRSVAYGDGVYKSDDGGRSWTNVGLKTSEHIGRIVISPKDGNVVYVAAQGPLWAPGGDRGLYKTTDGGKTWNRVLNIDENTGVTDVVLDPRNPDVLIAASYQRRRHVWTLVNGGPGSAIHRSTDGGKTWKKVTEGCCMRTSRRRTAKAASIAPPTTASRGRSAATTTRARCTTATSSPIRSASIAFTCPTSSSRSQTMPGRRSGRSGSGTCTSTTTSSGSIRRIRAIFSSATTAGCIARSIAARRGRSSRTCRSRSTTTSTSTTRRRSTTCTADSRTTTRSAVRTSIPKIRTPCTRNCSTA